MAKLDFILSLREKISVLPQNELEERLNFYREMIEDRIEEGLSEEQAVSAIGPVEEIAAQIVADNSCTLKTENVKSKKTLKVKVWEIILLILGSPIWLSLLIAVFAVILSFYIVLWSVIVLLWALLASLVGCAIGGIASGIIFAFSGNTLPSIAVIGAGIFCAGVSFFWFYGCKMATKGMIFLTKKLFYVLKRRKRNV